MQLVRVARAVASGSGGSQLNVASLSAGYGRENHNIPANCICEKKGKRCSPPASCAVVEKPSYRRRWNKKKIADVLGLNLAAANARSSGLTSLCSAAASCRSFIPCLPAASLQRMQAYTRPKPLFLLWGVSARINSAILPTTKNRCIICNGLPCGSLRREGDSNPRYSNPVRQFSKLVVSATHPSLLTPLLRKSDANI